MDHVARMQLGRPESTLFSQPQKRNYIQAGIIGWPRQQDRGDVFGRVFNVQIPTSVGETDVDGQLNLLSEILLWPDIHPKHASGDFAEDVLRCNQHAPHLIDVSLCRNRHEKCCANSIEARFCFTGPADAVGGKRDPGVIIDGLGAAAVGRQDDSTDDHEQRCSDSYRHDDRTSAPGPRPLSPTSSPPTCLETLA